MYITVFGLYVQITRVKKSSLAVADYGLITLFVLTVTTVVLDTLQQFYTLVSIPAHSFRTVLTQTSSDEGLSSPHGLGESTPPQAR